jgi:hypothetical protein
MTLAEVNDIKLLFAAFMLSQIQPIFEVGLSSGAKTGAPQVKLTNFLFPRLCGLILFSDFYMSFYAQKVKSYNQLTHASSSIFYNSF